MINFQTVSMIRLASLICWLAFLELRLSLVNYDYRF